MEWSEVVGTTDQEVWRLRHDDGLENSVVHFKELATIAARVLGGPESDFTGWLRRLKQKYHAYDRRSTTLRSNDGSIELRTGGTLHQLIRKSVDQCGILELEEQNREWLTTVNDQPKISKAITLSKKHRKKRKRRKNIERGSQKAATTRERIDAFIAKLLRHGTKINRKDIWLVAGYNDRSEFERFQRNDSRVTKRAMGVFNDILVLSPEEFLKRLNARRR